MRLQVSPEDFHNPIGGLVKTFRDEGITALWRGSVPALLGALSENAMAFSINGLLKRFLIQNNQTNNINKTIKLNFYEPFLTGAITGSFTPLVLCPCDVLKCRAQMNRALGKDSSLKEVLKQLLKQRGIRGLYLGFPIQITRDIIFYSSFFGSYDVMVDYMKRKTNLSDSVIYFTAGG